MEIKRDSRRIAIDLKATYRIWESEFPFSVITIVNISHTGICFRTDKQVESGCSVELKLNFSQAQKLSLLGRVIWSNPDFNSGEFNTGIKIMNVNSEDAKKFVQFYKSQLLYPPAE